MLLSALGLLIAGLLSLYSQGEHRNNLVFFHKQFLNVILGFVPAAIFFFTNPYFYRKFSTIFYVINLLGLVLVLVKGVHLNGSARWINIGSFQFQPSEMAKLLTILTLASYYWNRQSEIKNFSTFFLGFLHVLLPMVLIIKQPHLMGAMVIAAIWFSISLIAGIPWKYLVMTVGVIFVVITLAVLLPKKFPGLIHGYHEKRLKSFMGAGSSKGIDYQSERALIALGNGGVNGDGYEKGTQGDYIPEQKNDFVFTIFGEEFGLVGSLLLIGVFCTLFYRVWMIIVISQDSYVRMIAGGIMTLLGFHTFVNLFMVTKLLPVIGLWLPFMSYGGTSIWLCMALVGLALNLKRREESALFS